MTSLSLAERTDLFNERRQDTVAAQAITADVIIDVLATRHPKSQWLYLPEFRVGTGYGKESEQRIDAFAMHLWPSHQFMRTAYEIKVSRGDFLAEIKAPAKRKRALLWSNYFYFAAPRGLIQVQELPPEAGLIEVILVDGKARYHTAVAAPHRDTPPANWRFVAAIVARLTK